MTAPRITPEQSSRLSIAEQHEWLRRATAGSARRAAPGMLVRAEGPGGSYLAPFGRHIAYGADPTSQMSIAWQVAGPVRHPFIRIGDSPTNLGHQIPAEVRSLSTQASIVTAVDSVSPHAPDRIEQYYLHAAVSRLQAGQTYCYSVGHQGWEGSDVSAIGSFTTAQHGRRPFTFTAFGDQGVSYDAVGTAMLVRTQNPAFHLHAGDISYAESSGRGVLTDAYDPRVWDSFFTEVEPAAGGIPWQVAVGNHEMEPWYSPDGYGGQYARFDFPGASGTSQPPVYYSFLYGNVGVVSLDANDVSYEIPANLGYSGGGQVAWLDRTLASLRANPQVDFVVAYFHHCAYSTCMAHGCEGGVEQYFVPLFDQYQVDLVINGHNHIYERTDPLRGGAATRPAPIGGTVHPVTDGTTYITAGGAGKGLYSFSAADSYEGNVNDLGLVPTYVNEPDGSTTSEHVAWSRVRYTGYCLLVMQSKPRWSQGGTLLVRGLAENGTELDRIELVR